MSIKNKATFDSKLQLLRTRMRRKGDFPSLGSSIQRIQSSMGNDLATDNELVEAILSDVALTQKMLRLANSAMYAAFDVKVATVTQALHVLGTDTVGHLAMSLKLMDQLESAATTAAAKSELSSSAAAGLVSRKIAASVSGMDGEEASVSTLLQRIGWLLVNFYLPEDAELIRDLLQVGRSEAAAEAQVLGAPAWYFGKALGTEWGLPQSLCSAMNPSPDDSDPHAAWIASISAFSREFITASAQGLDTTELASRFAQRIGCAPEALLQTAQEVVESAEARDLVSVMAEAANDANIAAKPSDSAARLVEALTTLKMGAATLRVDQVVSMATELVHRSLGFSRTLFFLRSGADKRLRVKIAMGDVADTVKASLSKKPFHLTSSIWLLAIDGLSSLETPMMRAFVEAPSWYLNAFPEVRSFLLVPVCIGSQPLGMLYADWDGNARSCQVEPEDTRHLETIRGCMVQAFEKLAQGSGLQQKGRLTLGWSLYLRPETHSLEPLWPKKNAPELPSEMYTQYATQVFKGAAWFCGLGWFTKRHNFYIGAGLMALGAVFVIVGVVLYIYAHQSRMLEAKDALNALPKQAS